MPKIITSNSDIKLRNEINFLKEKNAKLEKLINKKERQISETNYSKIFKHAPIPVSIINKNGKTEYLNPFFVETFGYTLKDIPDAETWFLKAYPDKFYRGKILSSWKKLLGSKKNISNEKHTFYVTCKSGKVKETIFRLAELNSESYILLLEDISERHKVEAALRKSEEKFRRILENISLIGLMFDTKGNIIFCNQYLLNLTGWKRSEIINKDWFKLFIPVEIREQIKKIFFNAVGKKSFPRHYENEILTKKGERKFISWSNVVTYDLYGNLESITSIGKDITDKKQIEYELKLRDSRFNTFITHTTDAVNCWEFDTSISIKSDFKKQINTIFNGRLVECNDNFAKVYGYKRASDVLGKKFVELINDKDGNVVNLFTKFIKSKYKIENEESFEILKNGSKKFLLNSAQGVVENGYLKRIWVNIKDISEIKNAETALIESEAKFRTISEQAIFGIGIVQDDKYIYMNNEFANCIGYPKEELLSIPKNKIYKLVHPADRKYVKEQAKKKQQGSEEIDKDYILRFVAKDGSIKTIQNWSKPIKLNGRYAILAAFNDITEKVKAEQALKESEERFKGLFQKATVGIYRTSASGQILMANPAIIKMLGYNSFEELAETNIIKKGYVHKEDRIYFQRIMDKFGEIKGFESEWWTKNNSIIYVRESARAIKYKNGKPLFYEGIVEDITDKKKAENELLKNEQKYRTLFNLAPSGIILSDSEGNVIAANPAFCEALGYTKEEIIGSNVKKFAAPEGQNEIENHIKLLNEGKTLRHVVRDVTKDGRFRYMALNETRIPISESEYGILCAANDITERKIFEEELIKAKEKAEKSDRLKTEFLAQISHEIRTPINSILSFTSYLHDELKDTNINDINNIFEIIHKAGNRITRTIDMILNMSELQTGSYEPNFKTINLFENVIKNISSGFNRIAAAKNLYFNIDNKTDNPIVYGDEYTLNQIFDNLINNAFKYTPAGKIEVTVGRNGNDKLYAEVSDTGIGISEEFLNILFEPFSQEEQGYTRKFEGNGLGLALVKKYCEINNAEINVKSKKGVGTAFKVTFNQ